MAHVRHIVRKATIRCSILAVVLTAAAVLPATAVEAEERARYIVVLRDSAQSPGEVAAEHRSRYGAEVSHVYSHALRGYAAELPPQAVRGISEDPRVAFVEADQQVKGLAQTTPTGISRTFASANPGIDIDQTDDVRVDVDVAVIDSGIDLDHPDLDVVGSTNCVTGDPESTRCSDNQGDDDHGHGSHVAGTIGAIDNEIGVVGMAPGARLWAVKVLDATNVGWVSWIVAGIDWVTHRADQIEVANMSLGGEFSSSSLDQAIAASVDLGVVYAVAAGNSDKDANSFSPANHPDVITVSALSDFDGQAGGLGGAGDDTLWDSSNWGSTIEITAPGDSIYSTYKDGGYAWFTGTSMASPHVAGAAALLARGANDPQNETDVFAIRQTLVSEGNLAWVDDSGDLIQEPLLDVSDPVVFASTDPAAFTLTAIGYKERRAKKADLQWSGTDLTGDVVVHRNGAAVATTTDDGLHTDSIKGKGSKGSSFTYKVCEQGTTRCSNEATVTF